jgi:hypothetical protein
MKQEFSWFEGEPFLRDSESFERCLTRMFRDHEISLCVLA